MKRIIEVDENLICEGFVRNFTEKEKDVLINAIRYSIPYEESSQGEWVRKEDIIRYIATQYSEHNELVPVWLNIGDLKGGAE